MTDTRSTVELILKGTERGVVAATTKASAALRALQADANNFGKSLNAVAGKQSGLGKLIDELNGKSATLEQRFKAVDQRATGIIKTFAGAAAATGILAAEGGLVGQAFAGALPAVTALGLAGLTVKLGWDGVKKAFEGVKKPVDDLKKAVSGTFEKELRVPAEQVAALLPRLTGGFQGVATSVSGVVAKMVGFVASQQGVLLLNNTLSGTRDFIDGLGDGLTRFLSGFLSAMSGAQGAMRELGRSVGDVFGQIGDALNRLADEGVIEDAIRGLAATLEGLGNVAGRVVDLVVRLGAAFGDSFGVVLDKLAEGIGNATPGLLDLGGAIADLLRAAAPLLPVIGDLAGSFAHDLADGVRAVIPYVQAFADWASNNVDTIKAIVVGVVALAVAVKGLIIFTQVVGWAQTAMDVLGRFASSAGTAETKAGGLFTKLSLFKGLAIAGGLLLAAEAMDQINIKAAGGVEHLQGFEENLHDIAGAASELLSGDFGRIGDEFATQMDETVRNIQSGKSAFGEFLGFIKRSLAEKLPAMNFDLNTGPAAAQMDAFIAGVNRNSPMVNINGNTNGAGFALREILREIAEGHEFVNIDGKPMKAQDALRFVIDLINNSNPEVQINGQWVKAGDALAQFLGIANKSEATAGLAANPAKAVETVGGWTRFAEGTTGVANFAANPAPANATVAGWKGSAHATTGTATLDANPQPANTQTQTWKGHADSTTGTPKLNANPQQANQQTFGWVVRADGSIGTAKLHADPGPANATLGGLLARWGHQVLNWTVNILHGIGFAEGGPVITGAASGGPIRGPGTGTSDTAGLFRLSNGEHVLTAREVAAAGGHAAIFALRRSLVKGRVPQMTARSSAAAGGSASSAGALSIPAPLVNVQVHIDGNEVRSLVRTEINTTNRSTRRTVLAGAGASF